MTNEEKWQKVILDITHAIEKIEYNDEQMNINKLFIETELLNHYSSIEKANDNSEKLRERARVNVKVIDKR